MEVKMVSIIVGNKGLDLVHQHLVDDIIGQAAVNVNDRGQNLIARYLAFRRNLHFAGHGQTVHTRVQAADAVGQDLWQHRHHSGK